MVRLSCRERPGLKPYTMGGVAWERWNEAIVVRRDRQGGDGGHNYVLYAHSGQDGRYVCLDCGRHCIKWRELVAKPCPGVPQRPKYARALQQVQAGQELSRSAIRKDARYQSGYTAAAAGRRTEGYNAGALSNAPRKMGPAHPGFRGGEPPGGQEGARAQAEAGPGLEAHPGHQLGAQPEPVRRDIRRLLGLRPAAAGGLGPVGEAVPALAHGAPGRQGGAPHRVAPGVGLPRAHAPQGPGRARRAGESAPPDPMQRDIRALFRQPVVPLEAGSPRGVVGDPGGTPPGGDRPGGWRAAGNEDPVRGAQGATPAGRRAASAPPRCGALAGGAAAGSRGPEVGGFSLQPPPGPEGGLVPAQAHTGSGPAHSVAGPGRASVLDLLRAVTPLEPD